MRLRISLWDLRGLEVIFNPAILVGNGAERCWDLSLVRFTSGDYLHKLRGSQCISAQRQGYANSPWLQWWNENRVCNVTNPFGAGGQKAPNLAAVEKGPNFNELWNFLVVVTKASNYDQS